jgi:predicted SprT family Zn-dependent metalloprotease
LPSREIEEEYDLKKYEEFEECLKDQWKESDDMFIEKLLSLFTKPLNTEYLVRISSYGPLGSYSNNSNTITLNRYIKEIGFDPIRIIKHEIVHIIIQPFIEKYSIEHREKECMVNNILELFKKL